MARFTPILLASLLIATPVESQTTGSNAANPWSVSEERKPARSFDISDISPDRSATNGRGSTIVAGTEVIPNTTFGFGMFGEKAERPAHNPSINRDYAVPRTRKAAVGVALRF